MVQKSIEELRTEAEAMNCYLQEDTKGIPPEDIIDRLHNLNALMARSGEMLAIAKYLYNEKTSSKIAEVVVKIAKGNYMSATAQNALVKTLANEESRLVDELERVNRSCVHQIDDLRSMLSYYKEELRLNNTGY